MIKSVDRLPEKGKDIIGYDKAGVKHWLFRCACPNPNCTEWRCSISGFGVMINIVEWEYDEKKEINNI